MVASSLALTLAATFRQNVIQSYEDEKRNARFWSRRAASAKARDGWRKAIDTAEKNRLEAIEKKPEDYLQNAITYIGNHPGDFRRDLVDEHFALLAQG